MSILSKLISIYNKNTGGNLNTRDSVNWFSKYINKKFTSVSLSQIKQDSEVVTRLIPGQMVCYRYDAKGKDTLPVWDAFPLIIVLGLTNKGWHGLNLHYLPHKARVNIMVQFLKIAESANTESGKFRKVAGLAQVISRHPGMPIKQYLANHIVSPVMKVNFDAWEQVAFLPTAKWNYN